MHCIVSRRLAASRGFAFMSLVWILLTSSACRTGSAPTVETRPPTPPSEIEAPGAMDEEGDDVLEALESLLVDDQLKACLEGLEDYLARHPEDRRAHALMGQARFEEGCYGDAKLHLERAIALADTEALTHLWLGKVLAEEIDRAVFFSKLPLAKQLLAHFERAAEIDPQSVPAHSALARFHLEAPAMAGGSAEQMRHHIERLYVLDAAAAHRMEACVQRWGKDSAAAERELRLALAANSLEGETYLDLGVLLLDEKRPQEALPLLRRAVDLDPRLHEAHYRLAEAVLQVPSAPLEEAEGALETYLLRHPSHDLPGSGEAWFLLGQTHQALGDLIAARNDYRRTLEELPGHHQAKQALQSLGDD